MQVKPTLDFTAIKPTEKSLKTFVSMLRQVYQNLTQTINGSLGFGDGTVSDNVSGTWINVVAPVAPNTDFTVTHGLNRLPVGYWVMEKDRACDVYTGSVASTQTQLTLRATVASAVLRLFVVGLLLSFLCLGIQAQTTNLTIQVTDLGGQSWNVGSWQATLVTPPGVTPYGPPFFLFGTTTPVPNQNQSGLLSGTGSATITLTQNIGILPALSQWKFQVCSAATAVNNCFTQFYVVTAVTTLTITPPALIVNSTAITLAYSDGEVSAGRGGIYFNLITGLTRQCVTATGVICTLWQGFGGGSGPTLETNGVVNATQSILNLISGANVGVSADAFGGVTITNTAPLQASCSSVIGTLQEGNGSGGCLPAPLVDVGGAGTVVKNSADNEWCGTNPYLDIRCYARAVNKASTMVTPNGVTATCTSGLATVTLSIASDFQNNDPVEVMHCGVNNSGTTPAAPTVTPSGCALGCGTRIVKPSVAPTAGGTTYNYQTVGVTKGHGASLPSTTTTITTGQASLGTQTATITSITVINGVATVLTSAPHTISPGYEINQAATVDANGYGVDSSFGGNYSVQTVPDNTHYTFNVRDTRNGGATLASGGTVTWTNVNHIVVTASGGYDYYAVYDSTANRIVCLTAPVNANLAGDQAYLSCDDAGATLSGNFGVPDYLSSTVPGSATNDSLITSILSGAGSTSLTLNANAGASTSGTIHFDNAALYQIAATAANAVGAPLYYPITTGNNIWYNSSRVTWPAGTRIQQAGQLQYSGTWDGSAGISWSGVPGANCLHPSFAIGCGPDVFINAGAYPGVYALGIGLGNLTFSSGTTNNQSPLVLLDAPNDANLNSLNFVGSNSGSEYSSILLEIRGHHNNGYIPFSNVFSNLSFTGGPAQVNSSTSVPLFYCNTCGTSVFDHLSVGRRGVVFRAPDPGAQYTIHWSYNQGGINPFIRTGFADSGSTSVKLNMDNWTQDTTAMPVVSSLLNALTSINLINGNGSSSASPGGVPPIVTGNIVYLNISASVLANGGNFCSSSNVWDPFFNSSFSTSAESFCSFSSQLAITPGYSIFTTDINVNAPTCSVATAGPPFTPAGTYTFQDAAEWANNGLGTLSPKSASCTANGTTQQITVFPPTLPPIGSKGWAIFWNGNPAGTSFPSTTTTSYLFLLAGGGGAPSSPSGGPAGTQSDLSWSNRYNLYQYADVFEALPPANPAVGFERWFANLNTHQLSCLTNSGTSCASSGGTPASPPCSVQFDNSGVFGAIPCPTSPNTVPQALTSAPAGGVAVTAGFHLAGVIPRVTVCPSNLDTILATDRAGLVEWNDASACAVTLPQAGSGTGTNADFTSNFVFLGCNIGAGTATVTPTTSTISYLSGGTFHSAQTTMPVTTGQCAFTYSDNANYFAIVISATGVTSFTGDSVVYSNSGNTGPVTLTLNTQLANKVFANCTGSTANPTFCSITLAMLPGTGATTVNGQTCTLGSACTIPPGTITIANAGVTGTTVNTLTKLIGGTSTAVITAITDIDGSVGITTGSAGTAGNATIQLLGSVSCVFDGATIAGDYVQISSSIVGNCHDSSTSWPSVGQVIGRVLTTNGAAGTYTIDLFPADIRAPYLSTPTNNRLPRTSSVAGVVGVVDSAASDDGTTITTVEGIASNPTSLSQASLVGNNPGGTSADIADFQLGGTTVVKVTSDGNGGGISSHEGTCTASLIGQANFGRLCFDAAQHAPEINENNTGSLPLSRLICVNVTPVTANANVSTDQNLMFCAIPANLLNVVGRILRVTATGVFSTAAASTASITMKVKFCTVSGCGSGTVITPLSSTTGATAALSATNLMAQLNGDIITQTAGASSAYEAQGNMSIDISATATVSSSTYPAINTATVGTIDSTGQVFLQISVTFSAASASNSMTERQLIVEVLN